MNPSFLSGLNEEQLEAVTLPPQPALILAGAGSGKTRVLTTRIAWLIQTGRVSPAGLVGGGVTNTAAKDILPPTAAILPINTPGRGGGTFQGRGDRRRAANPREPGLAHLFQILDS